MRSTFALLFSALLLLSFAAWKTQPPEGPSGVIEVVRVSDGNPVRQAQIDLYNREHTGVHVNLDPSGGQGVEKVIVQCLGGVGPDVFDSMSPFELSAYIRSDIALDITEELKRRGIDLDREAFPGLKPVEEFQGRVYGVPTNAAVDAILVHQDLLDSISVPLHKGPWTWKEFIPLAEKLTHRDKEGHVIRYGFYFDWYNWAHFFRGFGARVYTPDGSKCLVDSPNGIAAVTLMHDLIYRYHVSSSPVEEASIASAGGFGMGSITLFGDKRAAMALGGRWWLDQLRTYKGLHLRIMESPHESVRLFSLLARAAVVNRESPHLKQAIDYVASLAGPDYNNQVNDQADGISAFERYDQGTRFLFNPRYPDEQDNALWRLLTDLGVENEASPYVNGQVADQIMNDQLDLVKADQKSPAQAMHDAAAAINAEIQKNLQSDPGLVAPKGRPYISEGRSPGTLSHDNNQSPEGAASR